MASNIPKIPEKLSDQVIHSSKDLPKFIAEVEKQDKDFAQLLKKHEKILGQLIDMRQLLSDSLSLTGRIEVGSAYESTGTELTDWIQRSQKSIESGKINFADIQSLGNFSEGLLAVLLPEVQDKNLKELLMQKSEKESELGSAEIQDAIKKLKEWQTNFEQYKIQYADDTAGLKQWEDFIEGERKSLQDRVDKINESITAINTQISAYLKQNNKISGEEREVVKKLIQSDTRGKARTQSPIQNYKNAMNSFIKRSLTYKPDPNQDPEKDIIPFDAVIRGRNFKVIIGYLEENPEIAEYLAKNIGELANVNKQYKVDYGIKKAQWKKQKVDVESESEGNVVQPTKKQQVVKPRILQIAIKDLIKNDNLTIFEKEPEKPDPGKLGISLEFIKYNALMAEKKNLVELIENAKASGKQNLVINIENVTGEKLKFNKTTLTRVQALVKEQLSKENILDETKTLAEETKADADAAITLQFETKRTKEQDKAPNEQSSGLGNSPKDEKPGH